MNSFLFLFFFLFLFSQVDCQAVDKSVPPWVLGEAGHCAHYGACDTAQANYVNCVNYQEAVVPDFELSTCPEFQQLACCDRIQHQNLANDITITQPVFGRCPACMENFRSFWCEYTCSPDQATFVTIVDQISAPGGYAVNWSIYHVTRNSSSEFYDSCSEVTMGATGTTVFELFGWDQGYEAWFEYMGNEEEYAPYRISYNYSTSGNNKYKYQCTDSNYTCSCVDCSAACDLLNPPYNAMVFSSCSIDIFGSDWSCWSFGVFITWLVLGLFGFFAVIYHEFFIKNRKSSSSIGINNPSSPSFFGAFTTGSFNRKSQDDDDDDVVEKKPLISDGYGNGKNSNGNIGTTTASMSPDIRRASWLQLQFYNLGMWCGSHPYLTLLGGLCFTLLLGSGILLLEIETDPVEMWIAPDAITKRNKDKFDQVFDPFYRIEQVIVTSTDPSQPQLITRQNMENIFELQRYITTSVTVNYKGASYTYQDLCNKPVNGRGCIIQSPFCWWQNNVTIFDQEDYQTDEGVREWVNICGEQQATVKCRSEIDAPQDPLIALGGFEDVSYANATAVVITLLLNNLVKDRDLNEAWEEKYIDYMKTHSAPGLFFSFTSERSIEDELNRDALSDIPTIIWSYIVMLVYVAVALGRDNPRRFIFIRSRITLSMQGVLLVCCSMVISVGIWSLFGVKATLIISQVIPFLILSIGLDNMFIMVNTFDNTMVSDPIDKRCGQVLASMGVSMTAASISETFAFLLGALTDMPAVQSFTLYAAASIAVLYLLQITCFIAFIALDARREQAGRTDCFCCIQSKEALEWEQSQLNFTSASAAMASRKAAKPYAKDELGCVDPQQDNFVQRWVENSLAPFIFKDSVRVFVLFTTLGLVALSFLAAQNVPLGLDQKVALPSDSFLQDYFIDVENLLLVGPPAYFVIRNVDFTNPIEQDKMCTLVGCNIDSLGNIVNGAATPENSDKSKYKLRLSNFLDDYLQWVQPEGYCCRVYRNDPTRYCPPPDQCPEGEQCGSVACQQCTTAPDDFFTDEKHIERPLPEVFNEFLPMFLNSICSDDCGLCGTAYQVNTALKNVDGDDDNNLNGTGLQTVEAARFMTYHTVLRTQEDFIDALISANDLNNQAEDKNDLDTFPYSFFYVYFEQYLGIYQTASLTCGLALGAVFILTLLLIQQWLVSLVCVLTMFFILVDLLGVMYIWEIDMNAVSVVNMVMCVGMSVEFTVHLAVSWAEGYGTSMQRAHHAVLSIVSNLIMGIAFTNCGIVVLAFSNSKIFEIYYFRMYISILLIGLYHGMIFLPIALSFLPNPVVTINRSIDQQHKINLLN